MLKCIALDDEPIALEIIELFCEKMSFLELTNSFTQASLAKKHLKRFPVDLIFLDIQMPDTNGIEFYKSIEQSTMVIFTTAFSTYAVEGFNVKAIDYLLKPITFDRFEQACNKALEYSEFKKPDNSKENCLYVRSEYSLVKIPFEEIVYCETMGDYVKIYRHDKEPILALMTLTKLLEKLPQQSFVRVHRSYIVSMLEIDCVRGKTIFLQAKKIPIGTSHRDNFFKKYSQ